MSRHIADHDHAAGLPLARFLAVARREGEEGTHPSTKAALRQPHRTDDGRRLQEFRRIELGHLA